jgi:hypothetical protein
MSAEHCGQTAWVPQYTIAMLVPVEWQNAMASMAAMGAMPQPAIGTELAPCQPGTLWAPQGQGPAINNGFAPQELAQQQLVLQQQQLPQFQQHQL